MTPGTTPGVVAILKVLMSVHLTIDCVPFIQHVRLGARLVKGNNTVLQFAHRQVLIRFRSQGIQLRLMYSVMGTTTPGPLLLRLATTDLCRAMERLYRSRRSEPSRRHIQFTLGPGDESLTLTYGSQAVNLPVRADRRPPRPDRLALGLLRCPSVPSTAEYPAIAYKLLRGLVSSGRVAEFVSPLRGLRADTAGLSTDPSKAQLERLEHRWRKRLASTPGYYLDAHVFLIVDPLAKGP